MTGFNVESPVKDKKKEKEKKLTSQLKQSSLAYQTEKM